MRLLVAIAGEPADAEALAEVRRFAATEHCSIVLATVGEVAETAAHAAEEQRMLADRLATAARELAPLPTRGVIRMSGDVARALQEIAVAEAADLILVAKHEHSGWSRFGHRRIAEHLQHTSPVPVRICTAAGEHWPADTGPTDDRLLAPGTVEEARHPRRSSRPIPSAGSDESAVASFWERRPRLRAAGPDKTPAGDIDTIVIEFLRTGFKVELASESAAFVEEAGPDAEIEILDTDAAGLGLSSEDFADGIVLCRNGHREAPVGWCCTRVQVAGIDGDGSRVTLEAPAAVASWLGR